MAARKVIHFVKKILRSNKNSESFNFTNEVLKHSNFKIGDYTYGIPQIEYVNQANLEIGKFCSIAWGVKIMLGGNHRVDWNTTYPFNAIPRFENTQSIQGHPATKGNVLIKNDVWIGTGALILSGVTIGNGAIIGANSVVTKNIGDYEIWAGNPAKFVRRRFENEKIKELLEMEWWNWPIEKILKNVETLCSTNKLH